MSFGQLLSIIRENERIQEEEAQKEITACPMCGSTDLQTNSQGTKLCPWCGWKS